MSNEDIQRMVSVQQKIFISLGILTLVSAGIAMAGVNATLGIFIALGIAFVQGVMILSSLMHLKDSSSMRGLIALTAFFVAYLLFATWLAYSNQIEGTDHLNPVVSVESAGEHE